MRPVPLVALATLLASPLLAQAPLSEKIEVNVVNVDVTVTDHGKPVHGLARDDFEIFEDGVQQPITNFYAVESAQSAKQSDDERFRRKVLLIIDSRGVSAYERDRALARIEEFINDRFRGGEYDWSIATVDSSLRMLLPPTSDKKAIHDTLDQVRKRRIALSEVRPPLLESISEGRLTVDALIDAMRAFGSANGKKIVLLLTRQLMPKDVTLPDLKAAKEIVLARNDLIQEANASSVNLYIVNPEGVAAGDASMYWAARETGGQLLPGNRVAESMLQFDSGSSNYYSLGYSPKHGADAVYHRITVQLKKASYALQYREGYSSLPSSQQIARTLDSPFGTFMISGASIPVSLNFDQRREVEDGVVVTMKAAVPAGTTFGPVELFVSLFDPTGRNVFTIRRAFGEATEFFVPHGKPYRVVVAVRDELSEAVGVTQQVVRF